MLISEPFYVFFCTSTGSFVKRQSVIALFSFPKHIPEKILACFYAHARGRARDDAMGGTTVDSDRESQVKSLMLCKLLSVIIDFDNWINPWGRLHSSVCCNHNVHV